MISTKKIKKQAFRYKEQIPEAGMRVGEMVKKVQTSSHKISKSRDIIYSMTVNSTVLYI